MAAIRTAVPTMRGVATAMPRSMPRMAPRMMPVRSFQTSRIGAAIKTLYTVEHEWVRYDDQSNIGTIGITNHAQDSLGDVVYIELPPVDLEAARGDQIGSIESVSEFANTIGQSRIGYLLAGERYYSGIERSFG